MLLLKIAMCTNMNWGMAYENMQFAAKVAWKEFCTDFWDSNVQKFDKFDPSLFQ